MESDSSYVFLNGRDINYVINNRRRIILRIDIDQIEVFLKNPDDEIRIWGLPHHTSNYVSIVNYYETGDRYLEQQGFKLLLWMRGTGYNRFRVTGTYKQLFVHTVI